MGIHNEGQTQNVFIIVKFLFVRRSRFQKIPPDRVKLIMIIIYASTCTKRDHGFIVTLEQLLTKFPVPLYHVPFKLPVSKEMAMNPFRVWGREEQLFLSELGNKIRTA